MPPRSRKLVGAPAPVVDLALAEQAVLLGDGGLPYEFAGGVALATEAERPTAEVFDMGILSTHPWPGGVSARRMVETGKTTIQKINQAVRGIGNFYVRVRQGAKTRCIDGRFDPDLDEENLGPQVPGGAPGAALAYRLGVDEESLTRGSFLEDAERMIEWFLEKGLAPGGHRDEHSNGDDKRAGCGFIDATNFLLNAMLDPTMITDHKRIVSMLRRNEFQRDDYLRVMGAAAVLNSRAERYFERREEIIPLLERKAPNSVATLHGDHEECIVAINFVPGETLSSNKFAEHYGVQAFGYDIWRSMETAKRLMPLPEQAQDRQRFIMARVMSTVATLMALTDGSLRIVLRIPPELQRPAR